MNWPPDHLAEAKAGRSDCGLIGARHLQLVPSVRANHRWNRSQWADIGAYGPAWLRLLPGTRTDAAEWMK
jgi:hypothetical protein